MGRDLRKSQQMAFSAVQGAEQGAGIAGEAGTDWPFPPPSAPWLLCAAMPAEYCAVISTCR